jgi:hypothetical protein
MQQVTNMTRRAGFDNQAARPLRTVPAETEQLDDDLGLPVPEHDLMICDRRILHAHVTLADCRRRHFLQTVDAHCRNRDDQPPGQALPNFVHVEGDLISGRLAE